MRHSERGFILLQKATNSTNYEYSETFMRMTGISNTISILLFEISCTQNCFNFRKRGLTRQLHIHLKRKKIGQQIFQDLLVYEISKP